MVNYLNFEHDDYNYKLNKEQSEAYKELIKFANLLILNKEHSLSSYVMYFMLNGPGGSGKTFLLSLLLSSLKEIKGLTYRVLAPTHKACNVIRSSLENVDVNTLAKFLGYKEDIDDNGQKVITYEWFDRPKCVKEDLLIIDECSMIDKKQLEVLVRTNINIIFVGDMCQINPVDEDLSEVFKLKFYGQGTLIKNERIKDQKLAKIILDYRESVELNYIQKKCITNEHCLNSREIFDSVLIDSVRNDEDTVYIAYTNSQVIKYNKLIRSSLFGTNSLEYTLGEKLIFTTYYNSQAGKFYTSQKVKISGVCKKWFNIYNPRCICSKKGFLEEWSEQNGKKPKHPQWMQEKDCEQFKIEKCDKCKTPTSMTSHKRFEFWCMSFEDIDSEFVFYKPVCGMKDLYPIIYKYRDRAKISKNKLRWKEFYNIQDTLNTPVEYSYAITTHKAQGSGYSKVFVDMENIFFCKKESEKLRLAYTAISRAQNCVYFFK